MPCPMIGHPHVQSTVYRALCTVSLKQRMVRFGSCNRTWNDAVAHRTLTQILSRTFVWCGTIVDDVEIQAHMQFHERFGIRI